MVSAKAGSTRRGRLHTMEPMPVEDPVACNRLLGPREPLVFDWVLDGEPPKRRRLNVVDSESSRCRRATVTLRSSQMGKERERFVARNRIEEPEKWLPDTPLPPGEPLTKAARQARGSNWLPVVLSVVAVAVLALAVAALVMEGHRAEANPSPPMSQPTP